jgi:hypothetical protein
VLDSWSSVVDRALWDAPTTHRQRNPNGPYSNTDLISTRKITFTDLGDTLKGRKHPRRVRVTYSSDGPYKVQVPGKGGEPIASSEMSSTTLRYLLRTTVGFASAVQKRNGLDA